jgi:uncharacterized protein (TIGR02147 family)
MQNSWIFSATDYRDAIRQHLKIDGQARGYRTLLAKAAGCQPAYLSQILTGAVHLTPEQASGICDFLKLSELESDYFLTLVYLGRAGNPGLIAKLQKKLTLIRRQHQEQKTSAIQSEEQSYPREKAVSYYLNWMPSAIHLLLMLPDFQSPAQIARRLKISEDQTIKILRELQELGIVAMKNSQWKATAKTLHAADESIFAPLHHRNWREKASDYFNHGRLGENLHYTSVHCLDEKTFAEIRELLNQAIDRSRKLTIPAPEETIACMNLDWFKI